MASKKCAICDATEAKTPCDNCSAVFYCSKKHQKKDWTRHMVNCKPYKIAFSDKMRRFMVSTRDIKPGEVIFQESPAVVGPMVDSNIVCLGCHLTIPNKSHNVCSTCGVAPVCSSACENKPFHAVKECDFYREKLKNVNGEFLSSNFQLVTPLRCLMLKESHLWEGFINLESHLEEGLNDSVLEYYQEKICDVLNTTNILSLGDQALVQKICAILDINSFELRQPQLQIFEQGERLRGIFLQAALMSHGCLSNTHLSVDDNFVMTVRASVTIKKGELILFNYASPLQSTSQRLQHLEEGKYFKCTCKRCCDPAELETYMGSIICSRCQTGLVIPTNPVSKLTDWYCNSCKHNFHEKLIKDTISEGLNLIESSATDDYLKTELLLKKLLKTFPQTSVVVVELKQKLIAWVRDMILQGPFPDWFMLNLTTDFCYDLLDILNITEPGISRIKGIILYELYRAKKVLANKEFEECEEIKEFEEFHLQLWKCEKILKEAISNLIYEPPHSPEGRLCKTAFEELKKTRYDIQTLRAQINVLYRLQLTKRLEMINLFSSSYF